MKFNWGTGITIAIIIFISFILFMVFKISSTDSDLYAKDYYDQEIGFQSRINAKSNTNKLSGKFDVQEEKNVFKINFPIDFEGEKLDGNIELYRPDNADRDLKYAIQRKDNAQTLDLSDKLKGHYDLKIEFAYKGTSYFYEKPIVIK